MANKRYISPVRLFKHCGIDTGADLNLSRIKKQLQAEFNISRDGFIEVDGFAYSRNDIMEEIDHPEFLLRWKFHKQIWERPALRKLLEENEGGAYDLEAILNPFRGNTEFDKFFSPYFAGPFQQISRSLLNERNLGELGELMRFEQFIQGVEREEAFRPTRIFLDEEFRIIRNVTKENFKLMRPKIEHWIKSDWGFLFSNLPDELYTIKYEIAVKLLNLGVEIQKTHRKDCRRISGQLVELKDAPENLRSLILSNHAAYNDSAPGCLNFKGGAGIIIFVIFILIRAIFGDSCNRPAPDYSTIPYRTIDSILRSKNLDANSRDTIMLKIQEIEGELQR